MNGDDVRESLPASRPPRCSNSEGSTWPWLLLSSTSLIQGCSSASASSDCGWLFTGKVEVQTWWETAACSNQCSEYRPLPVADAESNAANVVSVAYDHCGNNPTGETPLVIATHEGGRKQLLEDLRPDGGAFEGATDDASKSTHGTTLVHLTAGSDVWDFAGCNASDPTDPSDPNRRVLAPLGTWAMPFLTERIPEFLRSSVSCPNDPSGTFYAVPVGIHRLNLLIYNADLVAKYWSRVDDAGNLDFGPEPFAAFMETVQELQDANAGEVSDRQVKPIVVAADAWPQSLLLAENLMLAAVGPEAYVDHWKVHAHGERTEAGDINSLPSAVKANMERLALSIHLPDCADGSGMACTRADALEEVAQGKAAFTVMGDWVVPDLPDAIRVRAFPGTEKYFVYTADVLAVPSPAGIASDDPAFGVLNSSTSAAVQSKYSEVKHARPVTCDHNGTSVACDQQVIFEGLAPVPALTLFTHNTESNSALQHRLGEIVSALIPAKNKPVSPQRPSRSNNP